MSEHEHRLEQEPIQETEQIIYYLHKDIAPRDLYNWLIDQFNQGTHVIIDWQEDADETAYRKTQVDAILSALHKHKCNPLPRPAALTVRGLNLHMLKTGLYFSNYTLDATGHIVPLPNETAQLDTLDRKTA